jgi:hypothetical protein
VAKKGTRYECEECGMAVMVENPCECEPCQMTCCGVPMKETKETKVKKK